MQTGVGYVSASVAWHGTALGGERMLVFHVSMMRLVLTPHGHSWSSLARNRYISPIKAEVTRLISSGRKVP